MLVLEFVKGKPHVKQLGLKNQLIQDLRLVKMDKIHIQNSTQGSPIKNSTSFIWCVPANDLIKELLKASSPVENPDINLTVYPYGWMQEDDKYFNLTFKKSICRGKR